MKITKLLLKEIIQEEMGDYIRENQFREGKRKMKLTVSQLKNIILQELKIALAQSSGGCLGETEQQNDLEIGDDEEFGEPANYGSTATMGSISEDDWEDEDPYDAPPLEASPIAGRRGAVGLDIEEVEYWIQQVQEMPDGPEKDNMLSLIQNELFRE
tara:strand:- start:1119 stop:1589 length:471 start_codon:yes stop_codon:yes gene_type:complete